MEIGRLVFQAPLGRRREALAPTRPCQPCPVKCNSCALLVPAILSSPAARLFLAETVLKNRQLLELVDAARGIPFPELHSPEPRSRSQKLNAHALPLLQGF